MSFAENAPQGTGESPSRELATAPPADGRMATVEGLAGLGARASVHNFVGDRMQIWRSLSLGENQSEPGNDYIGKGPISIVNWYLHRIRIGGTTEGEYTEPVRTVLYTDDGKILHFVSDGIVKAVAKIIATFGMGPYAPPIRVEVIEIRTGSGYKMMSLIPAE